MSEKSDRIKGIEEYYALKSEKEKPVIQTEPPSKDNKNGKIPWQFKVMLGVGSMIFVILGVISLVNLSNKQPANKATNVILITLDAVRADRLSPFATDEFVFTPNIGKLAENSYKFNNVRTTNPLTLPAHVSLMTGRYPLAHKVRDNRNFKLPEQELTLAETMKENGYKTGAFVSAATTAGELGLNQGFDVYDDAFLREEHADKDIVIPERRADSTIAESLKWLKGMKQNDKFFMFLHLFDAHYPYNAPKDFRPEANKRAAIKDLPTSMQPTNYDAEISYIDICLSELFNYLADSGKLEDTIVVITADHGEGMQEHNESTHGYFAYDTTMRIPLIVYFPQKLQPKPAEIDANLSIVDIAPSILDVLNFKKPENSPKMNGLSFKNLLDPEKAKVDTIFSTRNVYFESFYPLYAFNYSPVLGLRNGEHTFLFSNPSELYKNDDFMQKNNVFEGFNSDELMDKFRDVFAQYKKESPGNPFNVASDETGSFNRNSYMPSLKQETKKDANISKTADAVQISLFNTEATLEINEKLVSPMLKADEIKNYELAERSYSRGLYNQTVATLKELVNENPEHAPAYLLLTSCYQKLGRNSLLAKKNAILKFNANAKPHELKITGDDRAEVLENYKKAYINYGKYLQILGKRGFLNQSIKENAGILCFLAGKYTQAVEHLKSAAKDPIDLSQNSKLMLVLSMHYLGKSLSAQSQLDSFVPTQDSELYKLYELMEKYENPEELNPFFGLP